MSWPYRPWEPDDQNLPYQRYDADSGGWFYRFHDRNGQYTHLWAPSIDVWAAAIGRGMIAAQQAARPVGIMPDVSKIRHAKQPIPKL